MAPLAVGSLSDSEDIGKTGLFMALISPSHLYRSDVDPAPFAPALQGAFGQLHALGAFKQRVFVGRVLADMANEHFPLLLEAVVGDGILRQLLPVGIEIVGTLLVGVPHRPWCRLPRLNDAIGQTGHRRTMGAIDLESNEVVAIRS